LAPGGGWSMVRDWGASTLSWDTTGLAAGTYWFQVWTRATGSSATPYESYTEAAYSLTPGAGPVACTNASVAANPASPQASGAAVTFTGGASGCTTSQFKYWMLAPGAGWSVVRDWGASTLSWDTTALAAGTYWFQVWVRATGSSATPYETYTEASYV